MNPGYVAEKPLGYMQVPAGTIDTVQTLAQMITAAGGVLPPGVTQINFTVEVQAVRWRDDGGVPTASLGYPLGVTGELRYTAQGASRLRFISQTAGAVVNMNFYGQGI